MAANAIDLTTAATVAADLGITSSATVERVVTAASRAIATYCGRTFERATGIIEYPASSGRPFLILTRPPIISITSIVELGETVDASDYECVGLDVDAGLVYKKTGAWSIVGRFGGRITDTLDALQGEVGDAGIKVTYTGGYVTPGQNALDPVTYATVTVPADLQEAAIMTACAIYRARGRDQDVAAESLGDWSATYRARSDLSAIPAAARDLILPYARHTVG